LPWFRGVLVAAPDDAAVCNFVVEQIAGEEIIALWRETCGTEFANPVA
jgi:hypothetical protein